MSAEHFPTSHSEEHQAPTHEASLVLQAQTELLGTHPLLSEMDEVELISDDEKQSEAEAALKREIDDAIYDQDYEKVELLLADTSQLTAEVLRYTLDTLYYTNVGYVTRFQRFSIRDIRERIFEILQDEGDSYEEEATYALLTELYKSDGRSFISKCQLSGQIEKRLPMIQQILLEQGDYTSLFSREDLFGKATLLSLIPRLYTEGRQDILISNYSLVSELIDRNELCHYIVERDYIHKAFAEAPMIFYNLDPATQNLIAQKVFELNNTDYVLWILDHFPAVDAKRVADWCIESSNLHLFFNKTLVDRIDINDYKDVLLGIGRYDIVLANYKQFDDIDLRSLVFVALEKEDYRAVSHLIIELEESDRSLVYHRLMRAGATARIISIELERPTFPEFDLMEVFEPTVDSIYFRQPGKIVEIIMTFPKYEVQIIDSLIYNDRTDVIFKDKKNVLPIPNEQLYERFVALGRFCDLLPLSNEMLESIPPDQLKNDSLNQLPSFENGGTDSNFQKLKGYIDEFIPAEEQPASYLNVKKLLNEYGGSLESYRLFMGLYENGPLPEAAIRIGVTETGDVGLRQLEALCEAYNRELMDVSNADRTAEKALQSDIYLTLLSRAYRVGISKYTPMELDQLKGLIRTSIDVRHLYDVQPLAPGYEPKADEVRTLTGEKSKADFTEDTIARYDVLAKDIVESLDAVKFTNEPFTIILEKLETAMEAEVERLQNHIDSDLVHHQDESKRELARQGLRKKVDVLLTVLDEARRGEYVGRNFALHSPEKMSALLPKLDTFPALHSALRQLVFAYAFRKNQNAQELAELITPEPTVESLGVMTGFVEQIVNKETFGNYFSDKRTARRFKKLSSVEAINAGLVRYQRTAEAASKQTVELIPARGIALELSGNVGDACWAGRSESYARNNPNVTTIIMKRGETGSPNERLVGSAMFIETTDDDDNPVLLLRGINPIENYINKVRVDDFYDVITNFCRETAERKGMIPAIVIDDYSGGSGTNRPVLFNYMQNLKRKLDTIAVNRTSSYFNGYDVRHDSYAL